MDKSILFGMAISIAVILFLMVFAFATIVIAVYYFQPEFLCELCKSNCTNFQIILP